MPRQSVADQVSLPRSHYFITVSRGRASRTFAMRAVVLHGLGSLLSSVLLLGCGALGYLALHDDFGAAFLAREARMQYAYEDRLAALRGDLDRQTSRMMADEAGVESRVRDLFSRESRLESRAALMVDLATRTGALALPHDRQVAAAGGPAHDARLPPIMTSGWSETALPAGLFGYAPSARRPAAGQRDGKPHPEIEPATMPESSASAGPCRADHAAIDPNRLALPTRLALLDASLDSVERSQVGALTRIGEVARRRSERLKGVLAAAGLSQERFGKAPEALGGPFVPAPEDQQSTFGTALTELRSTLAEALHLHSVMARVPLAAPLPGNAEITSGFGTRVDPFLGRLALHTGVDLRQEAGAQVKSTAAGRVAFTGSAGGYGTMVEIDHGNGLSTRYAHLSEILVHEGDQIAIGQVVGLVGSTGRATGPHLHYEVRIDGDPVDPMRFLSAGLRLAEADHPL